MIRLSRLSMHYTAGGSRVHVLRDVDLDIAPGERVAIARALVHSPKVLLADEPTGNLDDQTGDAIGELLFDQNEQAESALVLVTHDLDFAARCDRVLRLHDGRQLRFAPAALLRSGG